MHYPGMRSPWPSEGVDVVNANDHIPSPSAPRGRLSREAVRLLMTLQMVRQVPRLATEFPHVLDRLAELWDRPQDTEGYFIELMLADRNGRNCFDLPTMQELSALRDRHCERLPSLDFCTGQLDADWRG
jgi:hypothetical protein